MLWIIANLRPLLFLRTPYVSWEKWSRICSNSKYSRDITIHYTLCCPLLTITSVLTIEPHWKRCQTQKYSWYDCLKLCKLFLWNFPNLRDAILVHIERCSIASWWRLLFPKSNFDVALSRRGMVGRARTVASRQTDFHLHFSSYLDTQGQRMMYPDIC